ncbi:unnamed protein product [Prorocentrum cordatum]|uniref:Replication-associated protein n=1 Tax=Prorocentrum cordatum TaxID=2364126 RepID=A0ABN9TP63_9DINO|nr:unnamed protein product [Polarella glacialis]
MSKQEVGNAFKKACKKLGQGPNLEKVHVFSEPHKRWKKGTDAREKHMHIVFKFKEPFAHQRLQRELSQQHGIRGRFSFNLTGYADYLGYCLIESSKKLLADIDRDPWSWPPIPVERLLKLAENPSAQMEGRLGVSKPGRKRSLLTFSEITDAFVEANVVTEKDAWALAKQRKVDGDVTLYNTLGKENVRKLIGKVRQAWNPEQISEGTLVQSPEFDLGRFIPVGSVGPGVLRWAAGGWKSTALVLRGPGGLGKTEFACALMHMVAPAKAFHFLNKTDRLRDVDFFPGQGLVIDEMCLWERDIDDAKALVDVKKLRGVSCRNRDGTIPQGTPRIFTTNWSWWGFWPPAVALPAHAAPISRRVEWVEVAEDLRAGVAPPPDGPDVPSRPEGGPVLPVSQPG